MKWRKTLLYILNLLPHLLDEHLQVNRNAGGFRVGGFGAQGIGFAVHLLQQEVQPPANGLFLLEGAQHFLDVRIQPIQFLGHVQLLGQVDHLLLQTVGVGIGGNFGEAGDDLGADRLQHFRQPAAGRPDQFADFLAAVLDQDGKLPAFGFPPGQAKRQRLLQKLQHMNAESLAVGLGLVQGAGPLQDFEGVEGGQRTAVEGFHFAGGGEQLGDESAIQADRGFALLGLLPGEGAVGPAALEGGADAPADVRLQEAEGVGKAQGDVEIPVVDRAHFPGEEPAENFPFGTGERCHTSNHGYTLANSNWRQMVSGIHSMRKPIQSSSEPGSESKDSSGGKHFLKPGTVIDQYIIERPIGGGGFGAVYLARQMQDQMQVAIKEYLPRRLVYRNEDQQVVAKDEHARTNFLHGLQLFLAEAKVLTRLKHPNIVEVLNFFRANSTVYLVMSYEYGKILGDYLLKEKTGGVSEQFLHQVFAYLLDGVRMVHDSGLLHLDIKPHNILIRSGGDPLLLDFGACQPFPYLERHRVGKVLSAGFSPLEQYQSDGRLGPWSDIYAVGATMRMCLDGAFPPAAMDRAANDTLMPAAKAFKRRYSPCILEAIDWAMSINPEERPQSVEAFLAAMSAVPPASDKPAP